MEGRLEHQPALDGLRGVAVLAVIAFHLWPDLLPGGFLGVDTFFVVSGYLITGLLLAEHRASGGIDLRAFWLRRARRLLPALFVLLSVVAAAAAAWWPAQDLARVRGDALAGLGYVANWHALAGGDGYFDSVRGPSPLGHLWSLAIEEQFYVVWPLVLLAVLRRRSGAGARAARSVAVVAAAGIVASVAALVLLRGDLDRAYYGTDTRLHALLVGALLATVLPIGAAGRRVRPGLATAALVASAASWFLVDETAAWLFTVGLPLHAALTALVIAGAVGGGKAPAVLTHAWTVAVGRVSYGLYLWHWPVIVVLTPGRTGLGGAGLLTLRAAVTVGLTVLSYRFVEQPVRRLRVTGRRLLVL
ncbi:MAG: acyltransferase, partial [Acidimicrobiia bacterium]|nr:acyltransferase [Acidimicrobiia bacterium]